METGYYRDTKAICKKMLVPFLEMLEDQRGSVTQERWLEQLSKTELRITQNPEQYLGRDLPDVEMIIKIVKDIFGEFRESQFLPS